MTIDNYDPATARRAYYPASTDRPARVHTREAILAELSEVKIVQFFKGSGTDPTGLTGYASDKLWLDVEAGVTESAGVVRAYAGGDETLLASWPVADRGAVLAHLGDLAGSYLSTVASRTALKAIDTNSIVSVFLSEEGRNGAFTYELGDYSAFVTADTLEGIYIPADGIATTTGCWVRAYSGDISVKWFGASASATASANNDAINAAVDLAAQLTSKTGPVVTVTLDNEQYTTSLAITMIETANVVLCDGSLLADSGFPSSTPLIKIASSATIKNTAGTRLRNLYLDCANEAETGVWCDDTQKCHISHVRIEYFTEYGVRATNTNTELQITECEIRQFSFGDSGYDTQANRTATCIYVDSSDVILTNNILHYAKYPLRIGPNTFGFKSFGGHYYNGAAEPVSTAITNAANNGSGLIRITATGHAA